MLRLKTFGRLSLWRDAAKLPAAGAPPHALPLLAILGVAGDRPVGADDLVALLWPEDGREPGRTKLEGLVAALPSWLGNLQPVQRGADGFCLEPSVISCDVRDFEFAAATGAPDQASRLFEGPFLEGVTSPSKPFERWREREAARLAQIAKWCRESLRPRRSKAQLIAGSQIGHGGRYRIEREIGVGGAATVYLAHDSRHDRPVAIKVLREDISETISPERFEREIKFVAQLQHPHILPLFDSGEHGSALYSVMPYVDGETVRQRITREGRLQVDDAVRIAAEIADALAHAHEHKVLHRDVKPENILLSDGHPLLTDFGIARTVDPNATGRTTLPGVVLGTVPYMSPEQATGEANLDGRTDVYALGAVLYEMLCGKPPFAGEPSRRMMTRRLTEVPPRVSKMGVTLPESVDEILLRALQPSAEDRATARELADALALAERHLTGEAKARRRKRKLRPVVMATITVVVLAALLLVGRCAGVGSAAVVALAADTTLLQRMLVAEDARGKGKVGTAPLLEGLRSTDTAVRRVAIRGLGRLQLPSMVAMIGPFLDDKSPTIRIEAANAVAQSVASVRRGPDAPMATRAAVREAVRLLTLRLNDETHLATVGVLVRSLGRLPFADTADARAMDGPVFRALNRLA
ncbi:MAG: protein kinase, partial [Gemmatimonadales bacterium]